MENSSGRSRGLLAMSVVVCIYGVSYISREVVGKYLPTVVILAVQMGIMLIIFTLYNILTKKCMKIRKKDILPVIISGLFGTTLFQGFTILSVNSIGASVSTMLYGFAAVFALIIEILLFKRKKTALGVVSILISLAGVYILMGININDLASTNFKGYSLSLLSIISWVIYCFMAGRISEGYDKTVLLNYQALVGAVTTIPFVFFTNVPVNVFAVPEVIVNLVILGVFNSTITYFLNIYAIKKIGVTVSNLMLDFLPVVTIIITLILYHTVPTSNQIIGGLIIIAATVLLEKDQRNLEAEAKSSK